VEESQTGRHLSGRGAGGEEDTQGCRILDCLCAALGRVWEERVRGVSYDGCAAKGPGGEGGNVKEAPDLVTEGLGRFLTL